MNTFCPFFKEKCKGNECVMWKDEKCLIIAFMENLAQPPEEEHEEELGDRMPVVIEPTGLVEKEVPDEIKSATPEELAAELIAFAKKEFPDKERVFIRGDVGRLFWGSKNVERWSAPADIRLKMEKAEMLAQRQLESEQEIKMKEQLEQEKTELPSLVNLCVDWAKKQGFKRVTQSDVDAFLLEKNMEILPQTKRSLYAMANVAIKSK